MANPASHFNLYDPSMDEGTAVPAQRVDELNAVPAQRVPDNGSLSELPPMDPQLGALQAMAIKMIMEGMAATPEKGAGGLGDFLGGSRMSNEYHRTQRKAQVGLNALNVITG